MTVSVANPGLFRQRQLCQMRRFELCVAFTLLLVPLAGLADTPAELALAEGHADQAVRLLQLSLATQPDNPTTHQLLCRVYYSEELPDPAITACEKAVSLAPAASGNHMWLGRAYGLKAENAGPFAGLSLAKKVRSCFERAAQLDPTNVPAQTALAEFYIAAPSIVGGGLDKAERIAAQMLPLSAAASHRLRAMAAEKRKDLTQAEVEFRNAGHSPAAWVDLGAFYQRHNQLDKAVVALQSAIAADRAHSAVLMDVASVLNDAHRSPDVAENVLRLYLASPAKSEDAPAFKVHVHLGKLLAQRGDSAAARREFAAALDLAANYAPARQALDRNERR